MTTLMRFFTSKWLISLLGLLALCGLIWFFGGEIAVSGNVPLESATSRLVAILVVVALWGLVNFIKVHRSNQASDELLDGIAGADNANLDSALDEDLSDGELDELKTRMAEATTALKQHFGKAGRKNLYELPWYLIIGPPGSGKTTLLANSKLKFSLEDIFGRADVKGVGGTRNCDWSFTDDAVFLDTAGRFTTQDSHAAVDRESWLGFLGILRKARPRRPVNGVIIALSLSELLTLSPEQRQRLSDAMRERIQELHKELRIQFPIYFVITKCDLLSGFVEFFADLPRDEWSQVWGSTFDENIGAEGGSIPGTFQKEFEALLERLKTRALKRMSDERDARRCTGLQNFPWQVQSVGPLISEFLGETFATSRYQEHAPLLRGVYLTSATQEGTPFDALLSTVARSFGVDANTVAPMGMGGEGRSYFITDLLKRVVFPESELAGVNRRVEMRRALLQKSAYFGTLSAAVLAAAAWWISYQANASYVEEVSTQLAAYDKVAELPEKASLKAILPRLDAARNVWRSAAQHDENDAGPPLAMRMFLYQGDGLGETSRDAYQRELNSLLTPHMLNSLAKQLRDSQPDLTQRYAALKSYVSLSRAGGVEQQRSKLSKQLETDWLKELGNESDEVARLKQHLMSLLEGPVHVAQLDQALIARVRQQIITRGESALLMAWLVGAIEASVPGRGLLLERDVQMAEDVFARVREKPLSDAMPIAYTRKGFAVALSQLAGLKNKLNDERWVLGVDNYTDTQLEQYADNTWKQYIEDYELKWSTFLSRLKWQRRTTRDAVVRQLEQIVGPNSPVRAVLDQVVRQTSLGGVVKLPGDLDPSAPIQRTFEQIIALVERPEAGTSVYDRVEERLVVLYGFFRSLEEGEEFEPLEYRKIRRSILGEASRRPRPLNGWLEELIKDTDQIVKVSDVAIRRKRVEKLRDEINAKWRADVFGICKQTVAAGYPFDSSSDASVPLNDFGDLFRRGGLLDNFYKESLEKFVDTQTDQWKWKRIDGAELGIASSALRPFVLARQIRQAFFPKSTPLPSVDFTLKPNYLTPKVGDRYITDFNLEIDGNPRLQYKQGSLETATKSITWPGGRDATRPGRVLVSFNSKGITLKSWSTDGPWAWLRSLDTANLASTRANTFLVSFARGEYVARYEVSVKSGRNPITVRQALREFRCVNRF